MLQTWSVRTYNILLRNNLQVETPETARQVADKAVAGEIKNAGLGFAIELYRASGLGVHTIYYKLYGRKSIGAIRGYCEHLDRYTFHCDMRR